MRQHSPKCLESGIVTPFPSTTRMRGPHLGEKLFLSTVITEQGKGVI